MKEILFVVDNMAFGGVSNALLETLKRLDDRNYSIDLLVLHPAGELLGLIPDKINIIDSTPFFRVIDQRISVLLANKDWINLFSKIKMVGLLKSHLVLYAIKNERNKLIHKKYEVEIAYKDGFCTIFTSVGNTKRKIAWIHNDYEIFNGAKRYRTLFRNSLIAMNNIVAVSNKAADSVKLIFQLDSTPEVIGNPVDPQSIISRSEEFRPNMCAKSFNFVSVGRLTDQKGYDRLVKVHKKLIHEGYGHRIYIVGTGEDEVKLKQMIKELHVEETFLLLGYQSNPYPYIKAANCYVMSSRHEASPLVIIESLILHRPILSTDVADVRERLGDQLGVVVENSEFALYQGMKYILSNDIQLKQIEKNISEYTYNNFWIMKAIKDKIGG
jgi:glycosyltransferase involved in cell wall biosynthesis